MTDIDSRAAYVASLGKISRTDPRPATGRVGAGAPLLTPAELEHEMDALADRMGLAAPACCVVVHGEHDDGCVHRPTVCQDCDEPVDNHDNLCPQAPLPEVIPLGEHANRWMVASKSAPGSYWPVSITHLGGATVYVCPCPAGRRLAELSVADQSAERGCRHLRAVVAHENERNRRPSMPCDSAKWVD